MSGFDLELLSGEHDRKGFCCGKESLDRYLRETARGHLAKGVSITRVLVERDAGKPKHSVQWEVRLLFFLRHSSFGQSISAFAPAGQLGPI